MLIQSTLGQTSTERLFRLASQPVMQVTADSRRDCRRHLPVSIVMSTAIAMLATVSLLAGLASGARIRGGVKVKSWRAETPFVGMLLSDNSLCTASRISPRLLLTAGHCVCSPNNETLRVVFGVTDMSDLNGESIALSVSHVPRRYRLQCYLQANGMTGDPDAVDGSDLAVAELTQAGSDLRVEVTLLILPKLDAALVLGTAVHGFGYGDDLDVEEKAGRSGLLKKGHLITGQCPSDLRRAICVIPDESTNHQISGNGDSGGPLIETVSGLQVGTVSGELRFHSYSEDNTTNRVKVYASLYANRKFLQSLM